MSKTPRLPFDQVLMDGIQDMVFIMEVRNSDFYYEFINRAAMKGTGLTQSVLGKSIREVCSNGKANSLIGHYNKAATSLKTITYEDSYPSPLGEEYYSETKLTPIINDIGKCTRIVTVVHDITEKKRGELELKEYSKKVNESNQRYRSLFNYNPNAVFSFNLKGQILEGNAAIENVTGYEVNELIHANFFSLVKPDNVNRSKEYFRQTLAGTAVNFRMTMTKKTGESIELLVSFSPILIQEEVIGVYAIIRDITENVSLAKKFKKSEQRFRIITEHAHDLITMLDSKGKIIYASPSYKDVSGFDPKEYIGALFFHNVHPDYINELENTLSISLEKGQPFTVRIKQKNRTEGWVWSELKGTPVFDDENKFIHMVCITRDIHLQKEYEAKLKHFAFHDSLSGLPNRRYFKKRLTQALKDYQEKMDGLAVIILDIDYFKSINDEMGHEIGDLVIAEFGKRIRNNLREMDMVARLGGDEFVISLPGIGNSDGATTIVKRIQKAIQEPWMINGYELEVTASMGIAMAPGQGANVSSMLKSADVALYEAKNTGRNSYKVNEGDCVKLVKKQKL